MLGAILVTVYVIACLFLVLVVLLQAGKGGGMGVALGGGASSVFGGRGAATFLTRLTGVMAGLFMVLSVGLSLHMAGGTKGVSPELALEEEVDLGKEAAESLDEAPAAPAAEEKKAEEPKSEEKPAEKNGEAKEEPKGQAPAEQPAAEKPAAEAKAEEKPADAAPSAGNAAEQPAEKPAQEAKPAP